MKRFSFLLACFILLYACSDKKSELKTKKENPFYDRAFEYLEIRNIDSALKYFDKAKDLFLKQKDSLGAGKSLLQMAILATDIGDNYGGIEFSINSLSYLDMKDTIQYKYIHPNYNNIAIASYQLSNYVDALRYYDDALNFTSKNADRLLYLNNKAKAYEELKNYNKAIIIYNQVLKGSKQHPIEFARSLANIALTKWKQNANYDPVPEFLESLAIRQIEKDYVGVNFCYAKLADYYSFKGNTDSALVYAKEMYQLNKKINRPDDKLEALYKLIKHSPSVKTKYYFEIYEKLDDSLRKKRASARNQFALIRYETEKNKADFQKAQTENIKKQKDIIIKNIGIGILIVFLLLGYFWYKRRQKILKQEKEIEVKNTELKYAKKVHDRVANRIYQVIDEIDNRPEMQKDEVAEKLDIIYNISRDLSYENIDTKHTQDFAKELSNMLSSYQSAKVNLVINGNEERLWSNVKETVKSEVFIILQELMTNMSKHSKANHVQLDFEQDKEQLTILYSDNGRGMQHFSPGNGLKNTETRIKSISGVITFDTKPDKGLKVKFSFPIY